MEFKLDASGIDISLKITHYTKTKDEDNYSWCKCSFSFVSDNWLNYSKQNDELFQCDEIDYLLERLQALLKGQIKDDEKIEFIEPDFSFDLVTEKSANEDDIYEDICLYWNVHLWDNKDGSLTENSLKICLYREDIEKFVEYLKKVAGC